MQVYCKNIISFMYQLAPASLAENWDNIGLILGNEEKEVKKILLCLDITSKVVEEALHLESDLIISHHPFIFKKIERINENEHKGGLLYKLIKADISVFCTHTNLDAAENGVNRKLAEMLELTDITNFKDPTFSDQSCEFINSKKDSFDNKVIYGLGAVGNISGSFSLKEFGLFVKDKLKVGTIRFVGNEDKKPGRAAVFCGSFNDELIAIKENRADVLVTGDLKYHTALDAIALGICIIDAGHFNTEKIILPFLKKSINDKFPGIEVMCSSMESDPFKSY